MGENDRFYPYSNKSTETGELRRSDEVLEVLANLPHLIEDKFGLPITKKIFGGEGPLYVTATEKGVAYIGKTQTIVFPDSIEPEARFWGLYSSPRVLLEQLEGKGATMTVKIGLEPEDKHTKAIGSTANAYGRLYPSSTPRRENSTDPWKEDDWEGSNPWAVEETPGKTRTKREALAVSILSGPTTDEADKYIPGGEGSEPSGFLVELAESSNPNSSAFETICIAQQLLEGESNCATSLNEFFKSEGIRRKNPLDTRDPKGFLESLMGPSGIPKRDITFLPLVASPTLLILRDTYAERLGKNSLIIAERGEKDNVWTVKRAPERGVVSKPENREAKKPREEMIDRLVDSII